MSSLYIQVESSLPINHPAYESNLIQVFGEIPLNWVPFIRVDAPLLDVYEKFDTSQGHEGCGCDYVATEDGFKDVWHVVNMNENERADAKDNAKPSFITTWLFDEPTCRWVPPVAYPSDELIYLWSDSNSAWVEVAGVPPSDGEYYFNVSSESWVVMPIKPDGNAIFNDQIGDWVSV